MTKCEHFILLVLVAFSHFCCLVSINIVQPETCYLVTLTVTGSYNLLNKEPNKTNLEEVIKILTSPLPKNSSFIADINYSCSNSKIQLNKTNFTQAAKNKTKFTVLYVIEPNDKNNKIEAHFCSQYMLQQASTTQVHKTLQDKLKFRDGMKLLNEPSLKIHSESCCEIENPFDHCCRIGHRLVNDTCVENLPTVIYPVSTVENLPTVIYPVSTGEVIKMNMNEENCKPRMSLGIIIVIAAGCLVVFVALISATICVWKKKHRNQNGNDEPTQCDSGELVPEDQPIRNPSRTSETNSNSSHNRPISHSDMNIDVKKLIPFKDIRFTGPILGRGQFGQVELVEVNIKGTTTKCAAKMIKGRGTSEDEKDLFQELEMLYRIPYHPNVVSLLGASMEIDKPLYVFVEYCAKGNLSTFLQKHKQSNEYVNMCKMLDLRWKLKRAIEICTGMVFLTQKQIIHRDLAARNILLNENEVAKICDFGMAKDVYLRGLYIKETPGFLPVRWMAIESIESSIYTTKSDMWSFGVLLWELYMDGMPPYPGILETGKLLGYLKSGYRMSQPENCPDEFYNLMGRCWLRNPDDRPLFMQARRELKIILEAEARKESAASRKTEVSDDSSVFEEQEEAIKETNNKNGILNYGRSHSNDEIELNTLNETENTYL